MLNEFVDKSPGDVVREEIENLFRLAVSAAKLAVERGACRNARKVNAALIDHLHAAVAGAWLYSQTRAANAVSSIGSSELSRGEHSPLLRILVSHHMWCERLLCQNHAAVAPSDFWRLDFGLLPAQRSVRMD
jgi:hypothetical protein